MKRFGVRDGSSVRSISPIIAILLLTLITLAAGVAVYVYVIGFVGNSQSHTPSMGSIAVENFCANVQGSQCNGNGYSITMLNAGSSSIASGIIDIYFTDVLSGRSAEITCQLSSPWAAGTTVSCPSGSGTQLPTVLNASPGDTILLKVVGPDGSSTVGSTKAGSGSLSYVPITLTNSQSSATQDDLQVLISVDFQTYSTYLANDVGNIRFFNSTSFAAPSELPAWLENYTGGSGVANLATSSDVWIKLAGTIIPANSETTIYMVFESTGIDFDGVYWGEAPQLSTTFGEFDNGANVFLYYNASPQSTSGWTIAATAGQTASAPTGSYFHTQDAFYANSARGDYLYTQIPGLASNEVITFWTYTTGLGNVYFLVNSAGAGQMGRLDSRGGSDWSGLAATTTWTAWSAPSSGLDESVDKWYKYDIIINGGTASTYIGSPTNNLGTLGTAANTMSITNNGNYLGLIGDALGASYVSYWNGLVIRDLPPGGVPISFSLGSIL
jgi:hypothetical protein